MICRRFDTNPLLGPMLSYGLLFIKVQKMSLINQGSNAEMYPTHYYKCDLTKIESAELCLEILLWSRVDMKYENIFTFLVYEI